MLSLILPEQVLINSCIEPDTSGSLPHCWVKSCIKPRYWPERWVWAIYILDTILYTDLRTPDSPIYGSNVRWIKDSKKGRVWIVLSYLSIERCIIKLKDVDNTETPVDIKDLYLIRDPNVPERGDTVVLKQNSELEYEVLSVISWNKFTLQSKDESKNIIEEHLENIKKIERASWKLEIEVPQEDSQEKGEVETVVTQEDLSDKSEVQSLVTQEESSNKSEETIELVSGEKPPSKKKFFKKKS